MQTVQFKVLNIDTQETNVQMQTENTEAENKAQNTQNTEASGVESTGESAGTKKKTTVSTGQTGVTDAESAKWVAGLQLKKCAYEQVSAITEKIKDMLDPTSGMTDAQKSSYDRKVMNKVYSGKKLSAEEMRYIKIHIRHCIRMWSGCRFSGRHWRSESSTVIQKRKCRTFTVKRCFISVMMTRQSRCCMPHMMMF